MGFGDKLKGLREQAQQTVAENKDKIQGAVQTAAEVANARTGGKYADKISNVGEKLSTSVDKFADDPAAGGAASAQPAAASASFGEQPATPPAASFSEEPGGGAAFAGEEPATDATLESEEPAAAGPSFGDEPSAAAADEAPTVAPTGAPPEFE